MLLQQRLATHQGEAGEQAAGKPALVLAPLFVAATQHQQFGVRSREALIAPGQDAATGEAHGASLLLYLPGDFLCGVIVQTIAMHSEQQTDLQMGAPFFDDGCGGAVAVQRIAGQVEDLGALAGRLRYLRFEAVTDDADTVQFDIEEIPTRRCKAWTNPVKAPGEGKPQVKGLEMALAFWMDRRGSNSSASGSVTLIFEYLLEHRRFLAQLLAPLGGFRATQYLTVAADRPVQPVGEAISDLGRPIAS